jgi:hypothetical protein
MLYFRSFSSLLSFGQTVLACFQDNGQVLLDSKSELAFRFTYNDASYV